MTTCPICSKPLDAAYRTVALDGARHVNLYVHAGRCHAELRQWTAERIALHVAGQQMKQHVTR